MKKSILSLMLAATAAMSMGQTGRALVKPTARQLNWQKLETTAFIHFTVNTFTDKEWGEGTESPSIFNPTKLDARQWVKALKDGGFKIAIITAKHHDGFCLWPSKYTNHSVKSSPYKDGKGDVVKEVADACKEFGLKFGVYLSPWDRHEPSYGTASYNNYYKNQLRELLTNYGEIAEVWFDGAKGENAKDMEYDFKGFWQIVRELQPNAVMFSDAGPDVRWVGNEAGNAGETCWSTINAEGLAPGKADANYLNVGSENGKSWIPAETDVSIRPGWFWHEKENNKVRTPSNLVNLYYQSVGRNSLLLLNIPPNTEGLFEQKDVQNIKEFRNILNETFANNLVSAQSKQLVDQKLETAIQVKTNNPLVINLSKSVTFDRISLQENIAEGQRVKSFKIEYWQDGSWKPLATSTTIGYKRLLRFPSVTSNKLRLTVLEALAPTLLGEFGVYKASSRE
ncbi:alpha-L-fucosidase [Flectobacillus major]|uniref:alpha-L-fucosidase n=1 Tax=Flectobacillus major TaxID=103 RepID=UPI0003F8B959